MRSHCTFFTDLQVRYGEVDQQGVVYNGNYSIYADVAFEDFFRSKGYTYRELVEEYDSEVCHRQALFDYRSAAFSGDTLEIGVRVIKVGDRSFTMGFEVYRSGEEEPIVLIEIVYVGLDTENRRSRPITNFMRKILEE